MHDFLPLLKLQPHSTQFRAYQTLCLLDTGIRDAIIDGIIDVQSALGLSRLDPESRECLALLLVSLRLSVSKQAEVMTTVAEIGLRDRVSLRTVTGDPEIQSTLTNDKLNGPRRAMQSCAFCARSAIPGLLQRRGRSKECSAKLSFLAM